MCDPATVFPTDMWRADTSRPRLGATPAEQRRSSGAGGVRRGRVLAHLAQVLAREVVLDVHRVVLRALDDAQEVGHRRDLLDLLLDEPLHELLGRVVALLAREAGERVDLLADPLLLRERER